MALGPSFGVRLRSARERRGLALTAIADTTKIKLSILEALERDDVSQWPRGIFGRSHLRAYAHAVGLDPDAIVGEFLEGHPDDDEATPAILEAAARRSGADSADRPPRTRLRFLFDSAVDAIHQRRHERPLTASRGCAADSSRETAADRALPPQREAERSSGTATSVEDELMSLAHLCAMIGRARELREVRPVLEDALELLDAVGLVLWLGDQESGFLTPVLALGYSKNLIARLPRVRRDAENAIAAAVRSGETTIVGGSEVETGAVAVPLVTSAGCVGAFAVELPASGERRAFVCAFAEILTAQLAALIGPIHRTLSATEVHPVPD